jgi:Mn-dependent DtxR family transcriptional regulator
MQEHDGWRLTEAGRAEAALVLRGHRLWESYLARHVALATDHLHDSAERTEHYLTDTMQSALAEDVQHALRDPQGRPIPPVRESRN